MLCIFVVLSCVMLNCVVLYVFVVWYCVILNYVVFYVFVVLSCVMLNCVLLCELFDCCVGLGCVVCFGCYFLC